MPPIDAARIALESSVDKLQNLLAFWTLIVAIGLMLEYGAELAKVSCDHLNSKAQSRPSHKRPTFVWIRIFIVSGGIFITLGVAGELYMESRLSIAETALRAENDRIFSIYGGKVNELEPQATKALTDAYAAVSQAGLAKVTASNAMGLARGARQEADSFEGDINTARRDASEARALLSEVRRLAADAQQRSAEATEGVKRIESPRSLVKGDLLIRNLEPFQGTEYTFASVFQDDESIKLLRSIDEALRNAGWKRTKPPNGFPGINVYGKEVDFAVPVGFNTGIQISVDSSEDLAVLQSLPYDKLPNPVREAVLLNLNLSSGISPAGSDNVTPVNVEKGNAKTIRIGVGRKP